MSRSLSFPITEELLAAWRAEVEERFPGADRLFVEYALASEVVINVFGVDWWCTQLAGPVPDRYFRGVGDSGLAPLIHQDRVIGLGRDLLVCQLLDGFSQQRDQMRTRESIAAVCEELRVARLLHQSGHRVALVVPGGVKGNDYDLLVDNVLATEVKAKDEHTPYSANSLRNTLTEARSQLPSHGPGLLVLRLPGGWVGHADFAREAPSLFTGALRSSGRINAILLLWDRWALGGRTGGARATM